MPRRRVIENNDFRTIMSHDQKAFGFPASAQDVAGLVERVRGTGITTYVMDSIEYDNKVYFQTKRGTDWAAIDFAKYGGNWDDHYGAAGRLMQKMRAEGREALQVVIDSCRDMKLEVLAGLRMNDCHALEPLSHDSPDVSFHLKEHPEQAFCFPGTNERTRLADFANEDLRDYRFGLMVELMEKFDFDGLELNWVRAPYLFQPDQTPGPYGYINEGRFAQLAPIMTRWTADIRAFLDELGRKRGRPMVLGLRIPETPQITRAVGIDLPAWIRAARLDYIVPSGYHSTLFTIPVEEFKAMCAGTDCAVYPSMFPNVSISPKTIRTCQTDVYAAAAQTYYAGGADGVELFNHFHPACKVIGLPFNSEVFNVVASPQTVAQHPTHHYYIVYPTEPAGVADCAKLGITGYRGLCMSGLRQPFTFRFGEDMASSDRKLTRFRFKIFDMTPQDDEPTVWLNDAPVSITMTWRKRLNYALAVIGFGEEKSEPTSSIAWGSALDIEILGGEPIEESDMPRVNELLSKPIWQRPEFTEPAGPDASKLGLDMFMLVEVDLSAVPPEALHKGLNRVWIKTGKRRPDWVTDMFMGELEIVTKRE